MIWGGDTDLSKRCVHYLDMVYSEGLVYGTIA